jgi:hypothetical protein
MTRQDTARLTSPLTVHVRPAGKTPIEVPGAWIRPARMPRLPHRSPAGQCATPARVRPGVSTEPIEDSTARLIARASAVSTGSEPPGVFLGPPVRAVACGPPPGSFGYLDALLHHPQARARPHAADRRTEAWPPRLRDARPACDHRGCSGRTTSPRRLRSFAGVAAVDPVAREYRDELCGQTGRTGDLGAAGCRPSRGRVIHVAPACPAGLNRPSLLCVLVVEK